MGTNYTKDKKKKKNFALNNELRFLRIHRSAVSRYGEKNVDLCYEFAKEVKKEMGDFIKAIILFGSLARNKDKPHDIDILIIVNDIDFFIDREIAETYRILLGEIIGKVSRKIHVTTFRFTSFWEYVRVADPVAINILRDGVPIYDTGFFEPLQKLLRQGRIRPTAEAIYTYKNRAKTMLWQKNRHKNNIILDLYWVVVDIAHAALMAQNLVPEGPEKLSGMIKEYLVKPKIVSSKYALIFEEFYSLMKEITTHGGVKLSAKEIEQLEKKAEDFYNTFSKIIP